MNVVGGLRIAETAADLPSLIATVSSMRNRPVPAGTVAFGEVGLAGEVRPVPFGEERIVAAAKHGFKRVLAPHENLPRGVPEGIELVPLRRLDDAVTRAFDA